MRRCCMFGVDGEDLIQDDALVVASMWQARWAALFKSETFLSLQCSAAFRNSYHRPSVPKEVIGSKGRFPKKKMHSFRRCPNEDGEAPAQIFLHLLRSAFCQQKECIYSEMPTI